MKCEFCHSIFTNKYHLLNHQRTAKYCIKIQKPETFSCEFCDSIFENQFFFSYHYAVCSNSIVSKKYIKQKKLVELSRHENDLLLIQLKLKEEDLQEKNQKISLLEERLLSSRQTSIVNPKKINLSTFFYHR